MQAAKAPSPPEDHTNNQLNKHSKHPASKEKHPTCKGLVSHDAHGRHSNNSLRSLWCLLADPPAKVRNITFSVIVYRCPA